MSVWLDVTTMHLWRRPALGIVRVECEIARSFLASGRSDIRYCLFDTATGCYTEVSNETLRIELARLDRGDIDVAPAPETQTPADYAQVHRLTIKDWCKKAAYGIVGLFPRCYQGRMLLGLRSWYEYFRKTRAWDAFHFIIRNFGRKALFYSHKIHASGADIFLPERYYPPFADGDVYISLGIDWDHKDLKHIYDLKKKIKITAVFCCYDIIPIIFPQYCVVGVPEKFPVYFADVAWCSDVILCISKCSEKDLHCYLDRIGSPRPLTRVIRLGSVSGLVNDVSNVSLEVRRICEQSFILYVSTIERRKNHGVLYEAYLALVNSGCRDLPLLVFVGMQGWGVDELMTQIASDERVSPYLRILNHVSDAELAILYKSTLFTVYPSFYEGWGLPVAESLAYGKFCLASNAASIPEVGGGLVDYLDPHVAESWAATIVRFLDNPEELKLREQRIEKEYTPTRWAETAHNIMEIIETVQNS